MISNQGTAIGAAIDLSMTAFSENPQCQKSIVLITDGENHEDDAVRAAKTAKEKGVEIDVVSVGTSKPMAIPLGDGTFLTDENGQAAMTACNEEMAMDIAKRSDIIIAIFDSSKKLNEEDKKILELLKDKNAIILLNKIDLEKIIKVDEFKEINKPVIEISTKTKEGIDKLYEEISKMFKLKEIANDGETIVSNVRHKNIIINSRRNLEKARETINNNMPIDIIAIYIRQILDDLGEIIGMVIFWVNKKPSFWHSFKQLTSFGGLKLFIG